YDVLARAHLIAQFRADNPDNNIVPFVLAVGGVMHVQDIGTTDDSLFNKGETKPFGYVGVGAKYRAGGGWGVRVDARTQVGAKIGSGVATDFEILASLYKDFGAQPKKSGAKEDRPKSEGDPDKDGILGSADKCPNEAEDKDGFQDDDGCPDPDNDADGIA